MVLAGPGTGKTATIVEAVIARLRGDAGGPIESGRVLTLTFSRRAAAELRARIAARIGNGPLPVVATFHSFAHGLIRRSAATRTGVPRLLTAPEQERRLREMFTHAVAEGRVEWPPDWQAALGTAGLAAELRQFITRADVLGLTVHDLEEAAEVGGHRIWSGLARFRTEYLDVLDAEGVIDYTGLINRATASLSSLSEPLFDAVYVDEYQDTDPSQVRLLRALARPSTTLVAVGDPDQAIYRFRGADVGAIRRFRDEFPNSTGASAPIVVLRTCRRSGPLINAAARSVIQPVSLAGLPASAQRDHRAPEIAGVGDIDEVKVIEFPSAARHAVGVARLVVAALDGRRAHRWSDIAVLVRSGIRDLPELSRALAATGVPVAVPGENILLREDPGIAPLLAVLRVAARLEPLSTAMADYLAQSPLGGLSPTELRVVARELVTRHGDGPGADLVAGELRSPRPFPGMEGPGIERLRRLAEVIRAADDLIDRGRPVGEVLWFVWSSTDWPARLEATAQAGGVIGRNADRVLDAAVALFALAARVDGAGDTRGTRNLLDEVADQEIPGGTDQIGEAPGDRVALMTAHRSKGLEWPVVIVAGAQEDTWPDLRGRSSLLATDELGRLPSERSIGTAEALADERRLFFVACTRAKRSLAVTCVGSIEDSGPQPSRFVAEVARVEGVEVLSAGLAGGHITTVAELVADLRWALERPGVSPRLSALAAGALRQLASGSAPGLRGPVRAANPAGWWNASGRTAGTRPASPVGEPVYLSGSGWESIDKCSWRWFLDRKVKAGESAGRSAAFGAVVHALADAVATGELPADAVALESRARDYWPRLAFEAPWLAESEFEEVRSAIARYLAWLQSGQEQGRVLVGTELEFSAEIETEAGPVVFAGRADRVERGADGLHIVDFKTQRRADTLAEVARNRQLSVYQLAAAAGCFEGGNPPEVAGAELVLLRLDDRTSGQPKVQRQPAIDGDEVLAELTEVVETIQEERWVPNPRGGACRMCDFKPLCPADPAGRQVAT